VYDPAPVADAIVYAAAHPRRDLHVGAAAALLDLLERVSPSLTESDACGREARRSDASSAASPTADRETSTSQA
jgi:hypothetical protein